MTSLNNDPIRFAGRVSSALLAIVLLAAGTAAAQTEFTFSGEFFGDYSYVLSSPVEAREGDNGFGYRRLYLTTDFRLSDRFDGRGRLEMNQSSTNEDNRPSPFVKDAWLRWNDFPGEGHSLTMGVVIPPAFEVSMARWQYRSLAKTVMHRNGIVDSRDTGLKLTGPLSSDRRVAYAVMVANNSGIGLESNRQKRVYAQIRHSSDDGAHTATLGADYAALANGHSTTVNVFSGTTTGRGGFGIEVFANIRTLDNVEDDITWFGGSAFILVPTGERSRVIGRVDLTSVGTSGSRAEEAFVLVGFSFSPDSGVEIIPNVMASDAPGNAPVTVVGRMTLFARF